MAMQLRVLTTILYCIDRLVEQIESEKRKKETKNKESDPAGKPQKVSLARTHDVTLPPN
jgi:hypothetical protein